MAKKQINQGQQIAKIYNDFLIKVAKIEKERDLKINKISKKYDEEKIKKISSSLKNKED
ncbi:MAG: hypothetical protein NTX66_04300 [Candidatus Falkowbacteria bacterium]|nr:hypothetical protein [Candidatus Falkowbacteria bacterium]